MIHKILIVPMTIGKETNKALFLATAIDGATNKASLFSTIIGKARDKNLGGTRLKRRISRLLSLAHARKEKAICRGAKPVLRVRDEFWAWRWWRYNRRPTRGLNIRFITHAELPKYEARAFSQSAFRFVRLLQKVDQCDARGIDTCKAKCGNRDISRMLEEYTRRRRKRCQNPSKLEDIPL